MSTAARLIAYLVGLAVVFAAAWGVGTRVGPPPSTPAPAAAGAAEDMADMGDMAGMDHGTSSKAAAAEAAAAGKQPLSPAGADSGGLASASAGYTFVPQTRTITPNAPVEFAFTITTRDGAKVTAYDEQHDRQMHLVIARRDGTGFQHLLPARDATGTWRIPLTLPAPGIYRAYADFIPSDGPALVLGVDLIAPGASVVETPPLSRVAQVDGFTVRLDGELEAGSQSQVFATVSRDGAPVTDIQPYLGAFGHLVALRQEDFSYLHVMPGDGTGPEPAATDRAGPGIAFTASIPDAGTYRLFLEFRHADTVHTAEFTVASRPS